MVIQRCKKKVTYLLHELGIPNHMKGFNYLRTAIIDYQQSNNIYRLLEEKYNTKYINLEKLMRDIIKVAWQRGNIEKIEEIFSYSVDMDRGKPTNYQFIITLVDWYDLMEGDG